MTRVGETEADDLFRADAERLGYLEPRCCDVLKAEHVELDHAFFAGGRGLRAYYRDHNMIQPEEEKEIHEIELSAFPNEFGEDGE